MTKTNFKPGDNLTAQFMNDLQDAVINASDTSLKKYVVSELPEKSTMFDFENDTPLFTVPSINTTVKGVSETVTDTENGGHYQSVSIDENATIGSTANVYSKLDFSEITKGATELTIEFDFQYTTNGRIRIALADLDIVNAQDNADIRYNTDGIAFDIFSSSNNQFIVSGSSGIRPSFFGTWLHVKCEIDFSEQTAAYTVYNKSNESDRISDTVDFRGDCTQVTGIALYTWLKGDKVYFDNIKITASFNIDENGLYVVRNEDGRKVYIYENGEAVLISG